MNLSLVAISATSASDVWTVGGESQDGHPQGAIIEHYDGKTWTQSVGADSQADLSDITALAPNDVWAVGGKYESGDYHVFAEHYDGTSWSVVTVPDAVGSIDAVSGTGSDDVWFTVSLARGAESMHWNGKKFTTEGMPQTPYGVGGAYGALDEVDGTHLLAGGGRLDDGEVGIFAAQGDGSSWSSAQLEDPAPSRADRISAISHSSPTDAWAACSVLTTYRGRGYGFIEHWNGSEWSLVNIGKVKGSQLNGIASVDGADAWAVGYSGADRTENGPNLTLHWDGVRWAAVSAANIRHAKRQQLFAVTAPSSNAVFAVGEGYQTHVGATMSYVERWNGTRWAVVGRFSA